MRELTRCIAWTLALGAAALLLAAFAGVGLAQVDGVWAWAVLLVYSPFYLLGHVFGSGKPFSPGWPAFDAAVFGTQFLYFFAITAGVRYLHRKRTRRAA
jgi:hypothetical protein